MSEVRATIDGNEAAVRVAYRLTNGHPVAAYAYVLPRAAVDYGTRPGTAYALLSEGDIVAVKVIEIDGNGKMRLSRKAAHRDQPAITEQEKLKIAAAPAGGSA